MTPFFAQASMPARLGYQAVTPAAQVSSNSLFLLLDNHDDHD
jgi:hypothetical protein